MRERGGDRVRKGEGEETDIASGRVIRSILTLTKDDYGNLKMWVQDAGSYARFVPCSIEDLGVVDIT